MTIRRVVLVSEERCDDWSRGYFWMEQMDNDETELSRKSESNAVTSLRPGRWPFAFLFWNEHLHFISQNHSLIEKEDILNPNKRGNDTIFES
jgi:hypothetical protein